MSASVLISTYGTAALPAGTVNFACPVEISTRLFTAAKAFTRPVILALLVPMCRELLLPVSASLDAKGALANAEAIVVISFSTTEEELRLLQLPRAVISVRFGFA